MGSLDTEYELLQEFYYSWRAFHKIAKGNMPEKSKQLAAQRMLDAANAVETYRKPAALMQNA